MAGLCLLRYPKGAGLSEWSCDVYVEEFHVFDLRNRLLFQGVNLFERLSVSRTLEHMRRILGLTRYAVIVPAVASIIGAIFLMAQGSGEVAMVVIEAIISNASLKDSIVGVLTAVDAILLGTVLLVIGYGLYELFIDTEIAVPEWLQVRDLDDLKSKLIGVVVAIIAVVFVGVFVDSNRAQDVVSYGLGAGALVAGLAVFALATRKPGDKEK